MSNSREAEIMQALEDAGHITSTSLCELIDCSAPTARNRIANGGLRLHEAKLMMERTKDCPAVGDSIDDYLHAHTGRISVRLDDMHDMTGNGEEGVADALAAVDAGNRTMGELVSKTLGAIRDGEIDQDECDELRKTIRQQVRALIVAEKLISRNVTTRKQARRVRLAE